MNLSLFLQIVGFGVYVPIYVLGTKNNLPVFVHISFAVSAMLSVSDIALIILLYSRNKSAQLPVVIICVAFIFLTIGALGAAIK